MGNLLTNNTLILSVLLGLMSCSSSKSTIKTVDQYQSPIIGKEYKYIRKPKESDKKERLKNISVHVQEVENYFTGDKDKSVSFNFSESSTNEGTLSSINPYVLAGTYTVNHFPDSIGDYNGSFSYINMGVRFEYGFQVRSSFATFRPIAFQFLINYEMGDYYNWREKTNASLESFKNLGSSKLIFSGFFAPELLVHPSDNLAVGIMFGVGRTYSIDESIYISHLFGASIHFGAFTFSVNQNRTEFDHKIRETTRSSGSSSEEVLKTLQAEYVQVGISYSF